MKKTVLLLYMCISLLGGEALINSLKKGNVKGAAGSFSQEPPKEDERVLEMQKKAGIEDKSIKNITINVAEVNLSKKSSVEFGYSPKVKQELGDSLKIDNEEKATVKYNYRF